MQEVYLCRAAAQSSSWTQTGSTVSCVSSRNHCRSDPVQVQSTFQDSWHTSLHGHLIVCTHICIDLVKRQHLCDKASFAKREVKSYVCVPFRRLCLSVQHARSRETAFCTGLAETHAQCLSHVKPINCKSVEPRMSIADVLSGL